MKAENKRPDDMDDMMAEEQIVERLLRALEGADRPHSWDDLVRYDAGLCGPDEARRIAALLATTPALRSDLAALREFMAEPAPAASWLAQLRALGRRVLLARPQPAPPLAPVLRGFGQRVMRYEIDVFQVALSITPPIADEAVWQITGQVLRAQPDAAPQPQTATLYQQERQLAVEPCDELGTFAFSNVPTGTYSLEITCGITSIIVNELALA